MASSSDSAKLLLSSNDFAELKLEEVIESTPPVTRPELFR